MSNPFYTATAVPATQTRARSSVIRSEFDLVEAGFDDVEAAKVDVPLGTNALFGANAGGAITSGSELTLIGNGAGVSITSSPQNTAVGSGALDQCTTGIGRNTALGVDALSMVTTGRNNVGIGYSAGADAVRSITTGNNEIVMGNDSHTAAYIKVSWTVTSDARDKTAIEPLQFGLNFLSTLKPVAYNYRKSRGEDAPDGMRRYGFLAQEVLASEGDNPVIVNRDDPLNLKMTEASLIPVLVKAIQELKAEVDLLRSQLMG